MVMLVSEKPRLEWRRRQCRFDVAGFAQWSYALRPLFFPELEKTYAGSRISVGRYGRPVCPHQGMPLGSCPVESDGTIVCPLHGLRWHVDGGLAAFWD